MKFSHPDPQLLSFIQTDNVRVSFHKNDLILHASPQQYIQIMHKLLGIKHSTANFFMKWACQTGHIDMVHVLLQNPDVNVSCDNNFCIRAASENGHHEIVRILLHEALKTPEIIDPGAKNNYAIKAAAENGHIEVVRSLLLSNKVNPSAGCFIDGGDYPIRYASANGHVEIVRMLLNDPRVNPAFCNNFALRHACMNGHLNIVRLLSGEGKKVNLKLGLRCAVEYRQQDIIQYLVWELIGPLLLQCEIIRLEKKVQEDIIENVEKWIIMTEIYFRDIEDGL